MRFNLLSSFAAGILITTILCSIVYFSTKNDVSKAPVKSSENQTSINIQPSENEMKDKLASAGYVIQTKAEYDKKMKDAKASGKKEDTTTTKDGKSKKIVYRVVVHVSNGMTSIDVGKMLVKAKIIPDAFKFSKTIEKKGIENNLRPGTFMVDSDMSTDKIIATIFK